VTFGADDCNTCFDTNRGTYPTRIGDPGDEPGLGDGDVGDPFLADVSSVPNRITSIDAVRIAMSEKNPNANTNVSFFILIFYVVK
jgi:hypothetical protein